ncbi:MAG: hypothetical protein KTR22_11165 [Flavobacteriaceae bacterium]|nr:hypothetical protein [Flavobacteriaceae bacterium]
MKKKLIWIVLIIVGIVSCTKDDICEEGTLTTPFLVIEFKDANNNTQSKAVDNLRVLLNDEDNTPFYIGTSDTLVSVPLNTEATFTEFLLVSNGDDETNMDSDLITFTYTREDVYVNRACAFRAVFNDLVVDVEDETTNWIESFFIQNNTVEDETEAHLTIFH